MKNKGQTRETRKRNGPLDFCTREKRKMAMADVDDLLTFPRQFLAARQLTSQPTNQPIGSGLCNNRRDNRPVSLIIVSSSLRRRGNSTAAGRREDTAKTVSGLSKRIERCDDFFLIFGRFCEISNTVTRFAKTIHRNNARDA